MTKRLKGLLTLHRATLGLLLLAAVAAGAGLDRLTLLQNSGHPNLQASLPLTLDGLDLQGGLQSSGSSGPLRVQTVGLDKRQQLPLLTLRDQSGRTLRVQLMPD